MLWKTHLTTTACIGLPILYMEHNIFSVNQIAHTSGLHMVGAVGVTAVSITGLLFGSLLPDIDEPHSKVAQWTTKFVEWIKNKIKDIKDRIEGKRKASSKNKKKQKPLLFIRMINKVLGHRGVVHSLLAVFVLMIITNALKPLGIIHTFALCITLGFGLHLFEDWFSYMGIKWLCPLWNKDFKVPYVLRYKVGGVKENIILAIAFILLIQEVSMIFLSINLFKLFV